MQKTWVRTEGQIILSTKSPIIPLPRDNHCYSWVCLSCIVSVHGSSFAIFIWLWHDLACLCLSLFKAEAECTTAYLRGQLLQVHGAPVPEQPARQGTAPFVHVPPRSGFPGSQAALGKHKFSEQPSGEDCLPSSLFGGWGVTVSDGKRGWRWPSN